MPVPFASRPIRPANPDPRPVKITDYDQISVGQRGSKTVYSPYALVTSGAFLSVLTNTGDIAYRSDAPPAVVERSAVAIKCIVNITSNTSTAYTVLFQANSEDTATSVSSGAAVAWSFNVATNSTAFRNTLEIPLVNGKMKWTVITGGTPRYDINFFLTGWVLS